MTYTISALETAKEGQVEVMLNDQPAKGFRQIKYDHIATQTWFPSAKMKVVPLNIKIPEKKIGYLMGAGDKVGEALIQLGYELDFLDPDKVDNYTLLINVEESTEIFFPMVQLGCLTASLGFISLKFFFS